MTTETEPLAEEKSKPWHWPREWMRDQSFWRDIVTRTISGLVIAVIIYLWSIFFGYVKRPEVYLSAAAVVTVSSMLFFITTTTVALRILSRNRRAVKQSKLKMFYGYGAIVFAVIYVTYYFIYLATNPIP